MGLLLQNVHIAYPGRMLFEDLNLELTDNEMLAIFTRVLDGGTSLLRGIGGFLRGVEGTVLLDGYDIQACLPRERATKVGYVWENEGLISLYTIRENILLPLLFHTDMSLPAAEARLGQVCEELAIDIELMAAMPHELNDVQTRLINLARALIIEPRLLLIDELEGGMSEEYIQATMATLRHRQARSPTIIIITTANDYVMEASDRVLRIENQALVDHQW